MRWIAILFGVLLATPVHAGIVGLHARGSAGIDAVADDHELLKSETSNALNNIDLLVRNSGAANDLPAPWSAGQAVLKYSLNSSSQLKEISANLICSAAGDGGGVGAATSLQIGFEVDDSPAHFRFQGSMDGAAATQVNVRIENLAGEGGPFYFNGITGKSDVKFLDEGSLKPGFYQFTLLASVNGNSIPLSSARLDATLALSPATTVIPLPPAAVPGALALIAAIAYSKRRHPSLSIMPRGVYRR